MSFTITIDPATLKLIAAYLAGVATPVLLVYALFFYVYGFKRDE